LSNRQARPAIAPLPEANLGVFPTPLHFAERLTQRLGGEVDIMFKREDLTGIGLGGNKIRKLRYILAEASARGADVVLTMGGVQSNHCSATALCSAALGIDCEQFLGGDRPSVSTGNLRLSEAAGSTLHFVGSTDLNAVELAMHAHAEDLKAAGRRPFVIPLGGSSPLGVFGSICVVDELLRAPSSANATHIVTACGSSGTFAALVLGSWLRDSQWTIDGYCVLRDAEVSGHAFRNLVKEVRAHYRLDVSERSNCRLFDEQLGPGYGVPTTEALSAQALVAATEGVILDTTYTAKAMAGLVAGIRDGMYPAGSRVVFMHTGGLAGFLA